MASVRRHRGKWYVRYKDDQGVWRDKATPAATKAEAKRIGLELEGKAWKRKVGLEVASTETAMTLGDLMAWWLERSSVRTASHSRNESYIRVHIAPHALSRTLVHLVTSGKVEEFLHEKGDALSPSSINHLRGYLQAAFNAAKRSGVWTGINPVTDVQRRKVPRRKPDYLRPTEVPLVLGALAPKWRGIFATAIYSGLRKGEIFGLEKRDLDFEARHIYVRHSHGRDTTKSGEDGVVPMAAELVPFLTAAVESASGPYVFPAPSGGRLREDTPLEEVLRRAMGRAGVVEGYVHVCRKVGCGHEEEQPDNRLRHCPVHGYILWPKAQVRALRFHDLRHTTASLLTMAGCNPAAVQKILRHADPRITMSVYAHLAPGYLQNEVNRLSFFGGADRVGAAMGALALRQPNP